MTIVCTEIDKAPGYFGNDPKLPKFQENIENNLADITNTGNNPKNVELSIINHNVSI